MKRQRWSWSDVQGPDAVLRKPRGRPPGSGVRHPVTCGLHDETIVQMAQSGKRAVRIATALDCDTGVVGRRLAVLEREAKRRRIAEWIERNAAAPPHQVTAGAHDGVLIASAQQGDRVAAIAVRLDCSDEVVAQRLEELGEAVRLA